jgi:hypothetical protein
METIKIEGTSVTPRVLFSPKELLLEISGYSRPENARDFYFPLLKWLEEFKDWYVKSNKASVDSQPISFKFKFVYFNSSSAKFIYDLILLLSEIQKAGVPIKIYWYFDEDDDELREAGEELSDMAKVQMSYVEISH